MNFSMGKPFLKARILCSIIVYGLVFALCSIAFAKNPPIDVKELARTQTSWDGVLLPSYPDGQPEIRILSITVPAGQKLEIHQHPVINAGVLLSGHLRVHTTDGKVLDLLAGDAIVEVVNTWHWGQSLGTTPAHIIVFYAGQADTPVTVTQKK